VKTTRGNRTVTTLITATGSASLLLAGVWLAPAHATTTTSLRDLAGEVGLAETNETFSAAPYDEDGDGDQDVLISYHDQGGKLWRKDGHAFARVASHAFPMENADGYRVDRHDCAWADVNLDGLPDAFCSVGRTGFNNVKIGVHSDNELWLQRDDHSFIDVGTEWGVGDPYGRGRDALFIDANGDKWPDLYVGNEPPRDGDTDGATYGASKLFLNQHGTGFVDAPGYGLDHFSGGCAVKGDLDGDGYVDLITCSKEGIRVYHNDADQGFSDVTGASGFQVFMKDGVQHTSYVTRAVLTDLDGDGKLDFVGVRSDRLVYRLNDGTGGFPAQKTIWRGADARDVAAGDADGDGDPDLFLVLTNAAGSTTNPDDLLFVNTDLAFTGNVAPPATGKGDGVVAFDYNGDGRDEFLVLNGADVPGPVQLLSLQ
jgi:hypothetical protein